MPIAHRALPNLQLLVRDLSSLCPACAASSKFLPRTPKVGKTLGCARSKDDLIDSRIVENAVIHQVGFGAFQDQAVFQSSKLVFQSLVNDLAVPLLESDGCFGRLELDSPFDQKESLVLDTVMVPRADLAFEHEDQLAAVPLLDIVC